MNCEEPKTLEEAKSMVEWWKEAAMTIRISDAMRASKIAAMEGEPDGDKALEDKYIVINRKKAHELERESVKRIGI
jgi:hypothetical protein